MTEISPQPTAAKLEAPPPPKPAAQVTLDGTPRAFLPGETIIQFAKREGVNIPYYCWHPRLSIAANCRMCLVEVEKAPKLVPACQTECKDGMVVHTQNAKVEAARRAIHEFLLINHPIDCPICDQAGECKLQDYYMKFQLRPSRMREVKVHKTKLVPLGPKVMYNAERCIVCTRCVRFMDEVAGSRQLGVFGRGDHSVIGTFPGQALDSPYSLNTVDVCPVGALTSRVFRFKQRVWNLRRSASICPGCAKGCNVWADQRSAQLYRLLPRENEAVNKSWLCDEGRMTYARANDNHLSHPRLRDADGLIVEVTAAQALARAGDMLRPLQGSGALVVALSMHATCEEAFALGRMCLDVWGQKRVLVFGHPNGEADNLLRLADKNPNRAGIVRTLEELGLEAVTTPDDVLGALEGAQAALVVGGEGDALLLAAALARCPATLYLGHTSGPLVGVAQISLPLCAWVQASGTWVNAEGRAQALRPAYPPQADERTLLGWLGELAHALAPSHSGEAPVIGLAALHARMCAELPSFRGLPLTALPAEGVDWAAKGALTAAAPSAGVSAHV